MCDEILFSPRIGIVLCEVGLFHDSLKYFVVDIVDIIIGPFVGYIIGYVGQI